jgi:hypothetical protein
MRGSTKFGRRPLLAALAASGIPGGARAQTFPTGRVTFVVPFPPGASTDISTRIVADKLSQMWAQPVLIDNKGGANGIIAAEAVMRAKPDGYTVLATSSMTHAGNPSLYEKLSYDAIRDFEPITRFSLVPMVVLVHKGLGVDSLAALTAKLKAEPGKHAFGAGAVSARVVTELYKMLIGSDALFVGYKNNQQAINDIQSGRLSFMIIDLVGAQGHGRQRLRQGDRGDAAHARFLAARRADDGRGRAAGARLHDLVGGHARPIDQEVEAAIHEEERRHDLLEPAVDAVALAVDVLPPCFERRRALADHFPLVDPGEVGLDAVGHERGHRGHRPPQLVVVVGRLVGLVRAGGAARGGAVGRLEIARILALVPDQVADGLAVDIKSIDGHPVGFAALPAVEQPPPAHLVQRPLDVRALDLPAARERDRGRGGVPGVGRHQRG